MDTQHAQRSAQKRAIPPFIDRLLDECSKEQ